MRTIEAETINPATLMPPYHRTDGMVRVALPYRSKPVLDACQIEDIIAWLTTLK